MALPIDPEFLAHLRTILLGRHELGAQFPKRYRALKMICHNHRGFRRTPQQNLIRNLNISR